MTFLTKPPGLKYLPNQKSCRLTLNTFKEDKNKMKTHSTFVGIRTPYFTFLLGDRTPQMAITIFQFVASTIHSLRTVRHYWWPLAICSNAWLTTPGARVKIVLFYLHRHWNRLYGAAVKATIKLLPQSVFFHFYLTVIKTVYSLRVEPI